MIPNVVYLALRYFFLALLFVFIIIVIRAIMIDVRAPAAVKKRQRKRKKVHPQLIVVTSESNPGAKYNLGRAVSIGRAPDCEIIIDDTYVSNKHASVYESGGAFLVEDQGSTNGTYVNGRKISYPLELRPGDRIKIGKSVFEFKL
ncbi:MAG: FHA domain-containing protein [Actinobacteria bacterium]|nr:FHA domain-containing protein [Actinomycetota bacterium]